MRIYDVAEEAWIDRLTFTDEDLFKVLEIYGDDAITAFAAWFLNNIEPQHTIPGQTVFDMRDIIARHHNKDLTLTNKQRTYLLGHTFRYWANLTCQARAQVML